MRKVFSLLVLFCVTTAMAQTRPAGRGPQLPLPPGTKQLRDVEYVKGGGKAQSLDLFLPEKTDTPLPLVIWVHGGGWQNGSKDGCPPLRNGYTERGYAVASINYRLSGHERHVFEGEGHPIDQSKREEVFRLIREWFTKHGVLKR